MEDSFTAKLVYCAEYLRDCCIWCTVKASRPVKKSSDHLCETGRLCKRCFASDHRLASCQFLLKKKPDNHCGYCLIPSRIPGNVQHVTSTSCKWNDILKDTCFALREQQHQVAVGYNMNDWITYLMTPWKLSDRIRNQKCDWRNIHCIFVDYVQDMIEFTG